MVPTGQRIEGTPFSEEAPVGARSGIVRPNDDENAGVSAQEKAAISKKKLEKAATSS